MSKVTTPYAVHLSQIVHYMDYWKWTHQRQSICFLQHRLAYMDKHGIMVTLI